MVAEQPTKSELLSDRIIKLLLAMPEVDSLETYSAMMPQYVEGTDFAMIGRGATVISVTPRQKTMRFLRFSWNRPVVGFKGLESALNSENDVGVYFQHRKKGDLAYLSDANWSSIVEKYGLNDAWKPGNRPSFSEEAVILTFEHLSTVPGVEQEQIQIHYK